MYLMSEPIGGYQFSCVHLVYLFVLSVNKIQNTTKLFPGNVNTGTNKVALFSTIFVKKCHMLLQSTCINKQYLPTAKLIVNIFTHLCTRKSNSLPDLIISILAWSCLNPSTYVVPILITPSPGRRPDLSAIPRGVTCNIV